MGIEGNEKADQAAKQEAETKRPVSRHSLKSAKITDIHTKNSDVLWLERWKPGRENETQLRHITVGPNITAGIKFYQKIGNRQTYRMDRKTQNGSLLTK